MGDFLAQTLAHTLVPKERGETLDQAHHTCHQSSPCDRHSPPHLRRQFRASSASLRTREAEAESESEGELLAGGSAAGAHALRQTIRKREPRRATVF
jgi:hypothetical protein